MFLVSWNHHSITKKQSWVSECRLLNNICRTAVVSLASLWECEGCDILETATHPPFGVPTAVTDKICYCVQMGNVLRLLGMLANNYRPHWTFRFRVYILKLKWNSSSETTYETRGRWREQACSVVTRACVSVQPFTCCIKCLCMPTHRYSHLFAYMLRNAFIYIYMLQCPGGPSSMVPLISWYFLK